MSGIRPVISGRERLALVVATLALVVAVAALCCGLAVIA
jgi:hypothetical protein